jgi:hypothetical protein
MRKQRWADGLPAQFMTIGSFYEQVGDLRDGGGERLAGSIAFHRFGLVVVDTLSRAIIGDQNDIDTMTRALEPAQVIAHRLNCALLLVDHHRKGRFGDPNAIADILGSTAKGAMADSIWGLYREPGKAGAKLQIVGRDFEERTLALTFHVQTGSWQCEGEANTLNITERRKEIIDALEALGSVTLSELCEALDQNRGNTYKRLQDLTAKGVVTRQGHGKGARYTLLG